MKKHVFPYRRPSESIVEAHAWKLLRGDEWEELPETLPDWDYHTDLSVRRTVRVDVAKAKAEAGLPDHAPLALSASWFASGPNLRVHISRRSLAADADEVTIETRLDGEDLGGDLTLETSLVLAESLTGLGTTMVAHRAGSVLWSDRQSVRLQGAGTQFPLGVIDFAKTSVQNDAAWHLHISGDLHSAAGGSLQLLLNERHPLVVDAHRQAGTPTQLDKVVLETVSVGVLQVLLEYALQQDEFSESADYDEGSVGAMVQALIYRLFAGRTINDLRQCMRQRPNEFASDVQAAARIFEGL